MSDLFTKPSRLLRDLGVLAARILDEELYDIGGSQSQVGIDRNSITIDLDVEIYRVTQGTLLDATLLIEDDIRDVIPKFLNKLNNELQRDFIGSYGVYQIYDPKIISKKLGDIKFDEEEFDVHGELYVTLKLKYKILKEIHQIRYDEHESRRYLMEKYPELYEIFENPDFGHIGISYSEIMNEIKDMEPEFNFPIKNIQPMIADLKISPRKISNLILKANIYHMYPFLYSTIKNLNIDWVKLHRDLERDLLYYKKREDRLIEVFDFLIDGIVTQRIINMIVNSVERGTRLELGHVLLQIDSPLLTDQDKVKLEQALQRSNLYKGTNLWLP